MADERDPIEQLLDLVLFAPLGFALEVRRRLPELAAEGRQHAEQQVRLARFVGKFAVSMGRQQLERQVRELTGRSESAPPPSERPRPAPPVIEVGAVEVPAADDLPLAGYDTLAASQVVARLADLTPAELDLVRRYEEGTRRRRTVLGRIDQLQRAAQ
jgi:hypothetical protein